MKPTQDNHNLFAALRAAFPADLDAVAVETADDFAANTVFGLPALGSIPIRIDCGDSDPFYSATKSFIGQLPNPPAGGFSPGGHDASFWSAQLPGELSWLAPLLTA